MSTLKNGLNALLKGARILGLAENDLKTAKEFLDYNEFGLCFDTIVTQMYEYDIEIDNQFYELIGKVGRKMDLSIESYSFMKELIRDENKILKPVSDELAKIISSLKQ